MFILIAFVFIVLLVYKSTQREHLRQSDLDSITVTITDSQTIPSGYSLKYRCIFTLGDTTREIISDSNTVTLSESTNRAAFDALKGELTGNNVINDVEQEMTVEIFAQFYQGSTLISTSASSFSKTHTFSASGALIPNPPTSVSINVQTTNGSGNNSGGGGYTLYDNMSPDNGTIDYSVSKNSEQEIRTWLAANNRNYGYVKFTWGLIIYYRPLKSAVTATSLMDYTGRDTWLPN